MCGSSGGFLLWDPAQVDIPQRPDDPSLYPESDPRRWYDAEYAGWHARKHAMPVPPDGGPRGRLVEAIVPGHHPYWSEYEQGLVTEAGQLGMGTRVHHCGWDSERQDGIVGEIIRRNADMVIFVPVEPFLATESIRRLAAAGIPVIAANQSLEAESYPWIISWTGPNDWGQQRLLARTFARLMANHGDYCIISHKPGTSPYLARVWGIRTELGRVAPAMNCLDVRYTDLERERSRMAVLTWIERYGARLRGIVSADDATVMEGVKRALVEGGRQDIICVANGATRRGFELIRDGTLSAITYQSPEMEGALAVRTAADWFSGIDVEPIRYLPASVVTAAEVEAYLSADHGLESSPCDVLCQILSEGRLDDLAWFFDDLHRRIADSHSMSLDYFRGLVMEMVSGMLHMARVCDIDGVAFFGGYETLYRGFVMRRSPAETLEWMRARSVELLDALIARGATSSSMVDRLISYTELHYADPLALKVIAEQFGLSAAYLGRLFRERTGNTYSKFLNELRIRKAKTLLRQAGMKPGEVAKAVGYAESGYFSYVFRRLVGMAPHEYLKRQAASADDAATGSDT